MVTCPPARGELARGRLQLERKNDRAASSGPQRALRRRLPLLDYTAALAHAIHAIGTRGARETKLLA